MIFSHIQRIYLRVLNLFKLASAATQVYWNRIQKNTFGRMRFNKSKKLIFHIGFRKTGTSSIQLLLKKNKSVIQLKAGISTRALDPTTHDLKKAGGNWAKNDNYRNKLKFEAATIRFGKDLLKLDQTTIIVSDENIIGHNLIVESEDIFSITSRVLKQLEATLSEFDIHIIIYTRTRDEWLKSCYAQDVQWHRYPGTYEEWSKDRRNIRGWDEGYKVISDSLMSKLTFISMEDEINSNLTLGASLLKEAGLSSSSIEELKPCEPQNKRLNPIQLEFVRKINELEMPYSITHKIKNVVAENEKLFKKQPEEDPS